MSDIWSGDKLNPGLNINVEIKYWFFSTFSFNAGSDLSPVEGKWWFNSIFFQCRNRFISGPIIQYNLEMSRIRWWLNQYPKRVEGQSICPNQVQKGELRDFFHGFNISHFGKLLMILVRIVLSYLHMLVNFWITVKLVHHRIQHYYHYNFPFSIITSIILY